MITSTQSCKKSFSKYKPNLLEKYIACKTIKKRTMPPQVSPQQRMLFTQITPNQNRSYLKFKHNQHEKTVEMRTLQPKDTVRQPEGSLIKEDLTNLSKGEQDLSERKVTKISLLLKKLMNQQQESQKNRSQNIQISLHKNFSVSQLRKKLIYEKSQEKRGSFRIRNNLNIKQIEQNLDNFTNQTRKQLSMHNFLIIRNNHIRYTSTATKFKTNRKKIENSYLQGLKIDICMKNRLDVSLEQKDQRSLNQRNDCQIKSSSDYKRAEVKKYYLFERKRSERDQKVSKVASPAKFQHNDLTIEPWTDHQIPLNDQAQLSE